VVKIQDEACWVVGCDALWCCGRIPKFRTTLVIPYSLYPEDWGSKILRNVSIQPHYYRATQQRRPRLHVSILFSYVNNSWTGIPMVKAPFTATLSF